jgi:HEAT repeat protein/sugar lactone lactonase YvrE
LGGAIAGAAAALLLLSAGCERKAGSPARNEAGAPAETAGRRKSGARGATFSTKPSFRVKGEGVLVEFAVTRPIDVAVVIRDREGRVVRHLAAGVLGKSAPEPLARDSLKQSLYWNGTDDGGRPVPGGEYRAEVALGLQPRLDRYFGGDQYDVGRVHGLAVGPRGELYVMSGVGRDSRGGRFRIFTAKGKYVRTILPRPADLPLERLTPLGEVVLDDGEHFPLTLFPKYGSRIYQVPAVAPNGDLIFVNGSTKGHKEGKRFHSEERAKNYPRQLLRVAADGGASAKGSEGPVLGKQFNRKLIFLALGGDGETVYVSGARHAVFKVKWGAGEKPAAVIGTPGKAGSGAKGLKDPCGIALDPLGRLYVADRGNHRIACFDAAGKLVGEIKLEWPRQLAVHPRTGAIYATAGFKRHRLLKFDGIGAKAPSVEMPLKSSWPILALDSRGAKPVLYVANIELKGHGRGAEKAVVRLLDNGRALVESGRVTRGTEPFQPLLLGVDREREIIYGKAGIFTDYLRWDGGSGRGDTVKMPLHPKANGISEMTAGAGGTVTFHVSGEFGRIDRHLLPDHFDKSGTFITRLWKDDCPRSNYDRGSCIGPDGTIYHIHERGGYGKPMRVRALYPDGTVKRDSLIVFDSRSPAGIRVDRAGNVYVLDHLKPVGRPLPDAFAGVVKVERHNPFVYNYGSVLKFSPEGGRIRELSRTAPQKRELAEGQLQFTTAEGRGDFVSEGALWSWYGISMIQPALDRSKYSPYNCQCWAPRFDLDEFARVFVPDQLRCRIVVLDSGGNLVTTFGRYGNADDTGPGIPLADPRTVMVSRRAAYVGDMTNNRIVRVRLDYRARASCKVRIGRRTLSDIVDELADAGKIGERRRAVRLMNAEIRVRELREEALRVSPALAGGVDWRRLESEVLKKSVRALANADDARSALAVAAAREVKNWPEPEARALLTGYMKSPNPKLRVSVVWGLAGGKLGELGREILREALKDEDQLVRVSAAYVLLDRDDPTGLDQIFGGALVKNQDVHKLAETAIVKKVLVWKDSSPMARKLDTSKALVPAYQMDAEAVKALGGLLAKSGEKDKRGRTRHWYLRRASLFLLGLSGSKEAIPPLLKALRLPERQRNLNRTIGGLGLLRSREAVPDILKYLARGHCREWGTLAYNGDKAHAYAARALAQIGDPESVKPIIELLDSPKKEVRPLARRALSDMFVAGVPIDRCAIPRKGKLVQVRVDELPEAGELKAAWQAFWKVNADKYEWNPKASQLRRRGD